MIRKLIPAQIHDPGRGSFMVNALPVTGKKKHGQPVYTSCNSINRKRDRTIINSSKHSESYEFVSVA